MKQTLFIALALIASLAINAQTNETKGTIKPVYVMGQVAMNNFTGEGCSFLNMKGKYTGLDLRLGVGREFTSILGVRGTFGYNTNKAYSANGTYSFKNFDVFGDLTVDLADAIAPNRVKNQTINSELLVGVGLSKTFDNKLQPSTNDGIRYSPNGSFNYGLHFGANISYNITPEFAIGAEAGLYVMNDRYNGQRFHLAVDGRAELGINLIYQFGK